ncbi:filamentous hemagglutinin N-terminal domain-containing protein [Selenomonas caprae]|uniref:Filamentous hemagglutinin N-terminal domain-containing protein n=1 Tax=Selenomonas caprae TaxID=2606905 RepID=A0A5D6WQL3_9FIRM|nr:filamentous hemagglutinin N-terminal domain-containing protein [Selenomonas caprae]TYZ30217.1 filamentous hemagglutinin N-terminal domain-containing protein [Selenomonas caprae]
MRTIRKKALHLAVAMGVTFSAFSMSGVEALPTGGKIRSGEAEIGKKEHTLVIDQHSHHVALDWDLFNIERGESVVFNQLPTDIALNRVVGNSASEIYGSLKAGGTVFLINPRGILFGQGAQVDTGSLIASTAQVNDSFMTSFGDGVEAISLGLGETSTGKILNAAEIKAQGGLVALHAAVVENTGSIENPAGEVALSAAKNLHLAMDTAGKLNIAVSGEVADAHILNSGKITADGGRVLMTAKSAGDLLSEVVNHSGIIEAKSVRVDEQGEIVLDGGSHGIVNVSGQVSADGLATGHSGGTVKVLGQRVNIADGAVLTASGDNNGGQVETSGDVLSVSTKAQIEAFGVNGKAGEWFIDPVDIIITNEAPEGYADATPADTAAQTGEQLYQAQNATAGNQQSYINADYISWRLSNGTSVRIQAADQNTVEANADIYSLGVSNITVNSPIVKSTERMVLNDATYGTAGSEATLTLEAQRNVAINAPITATDGKLHVNLHADTDGDAKGMVILNADIKTNGGDFTAGCGASISDGRVGTYIGHAADERDEDGNYLENGDRRIETKGGNATFYGDVAVGLNQGELIIDTAADDTRGNILISGNLDSANSYRLYVNEIIGKTLQDSVKNDPDLKRLAGLYYENYLKDTVWKKFSDLSAEERAQIAERCFAQYGTYKNRTLPTDEAAYEEALQAYYNEHVKLGDKNVTGTAKPFDELTAEEYHQLAKHILTNWSHGSTNNHESILTRWETAKLAAQEGTAGGSAVGDKYLATITTELENWIVGSLLAGKKNEVLVGGKTAVVGKNVKAGREFYWVTGPEGEANDGQGTLFFTTTGNAEGIVATNMYQGWSHDTSHGVKFNDPNNDHIYDQPYVGVSWKSDASWADVESQNKNLIGFLQETNNARSSAMLVGNQITIGGNVGKSALLNNLWVDADDTVSIGGGVNHASDTADTFTGQVNADGSIYLHGVNGVNVGDAINSKIDDVLIVEGEDGPGSWIDTSLIVTPTPEPVVTPVTAEVPVAADKPAGKTEAYAAERPQLDPVKGTVQSGTASYQLADSKQLQPGQAADNVVERVLGLTTARLPVVRIHNGVRINYGMYALQVDPDEVKMEAVEQVRTDLPAAKGRETQRTYKARLTLANTAGTFDLSYDGAALSITPVDHAAFDMLNHGGAPHNVDVVSKALHVAFS